MKILIATTNKGKLKELQEFFQDVPIEFVSLSDAGITDDVEEDGKTYQENAEKKALFYAKKSGLPAIADDGGLEIAALNGEPGIHSRRWLGYKATDQELIDHMIQIAKTLPVDNRNASFVVAESLAFPDGRVWTVTAKVDGIIANKPYLKLLHGYPYRSFFYIPQIKKYYHESELTDTEMKQYNHRYKAVLKIKKIIERELQHARH